MKETYNITVGRRELDFLHQACVDNGMNALAEKLYSVSSNSPQTMYSYKEMENPIDEDLFIEKWHPDYNCDEIAWLNDIAKLLDGDAEPGDSASTGPYARFTRDDLIMDYNLLMDRVLTDAFNNYIKKNYPLYLSGEDTTSSSVEKE